jgi:hypothetical protein
MRDGIDVSGFWQYHRYDSPGILSYDNGSHAFILLAAKNQARWEIARFRAWLTLPVAEFTAEFAPDSISVSISREVQRDLKQPP